MRGMSTATYNDVIDLVGDVDDLLVERILETGASSAEVAQALDDLEDESGFAVESRSEGSPRIAAVRAILVEAFDREDEDPRIPGERPDLFS